MRNLKKLLAVALCVAMMATAMVPAFAAETALSADSQICKDIGMLVGADESGVTPEYTATEPTRIQAAVMFLRLKGLEAEAKAFTGTDNFADVAADDWFAPIAAYLKAKPELGFEGVGDNNFAPNEKITATQYYKVVLTGLGYKQDVDFKYEEVLTFAADKGLSKVASAANFTIADLAAATVEGLNAKVKGGEKTLATTLVEAGKIDAAKAEAAGIYKAAPATLEVSETKVNTSKSIQVTFNKAVEDTAKAVFTVTRDGGATVSLKAAFNADKTVATLSQDTNLPTGDYAVAVKYDTTDLGSKTVKVTDEKIASIAITSKSIIRQDDYTGFANYKVTNQYGEDVTEKSIASNLTWNSSPATVDADKGLLEFNYISYTTDGAGNSVVDTGYMKKLKDFTTTPITVSAYDQESGVVCTQALTVSVAAGDIQTINLKGIYNKDKKTEITRGTTDEFYIDYEIKDSNGDLITSYAILANALNLYPDGTNASSVNIAGVKIKEDPANTKKALFQVVVKDNPDMSSAYDGVGTQPINFISRETGKTGSMNIVVKDDTAVLDKFVIQRPSTDVTEGSGYVEIPYVATDVNGNAITSYSKIHDKLDFGSDSHWREVAMNDGSYKLYYDFSGKTKDNIVTLSVTVKRTFKYSTLSVTVKATAVPDTLSNVAYDFYMTAGGTSEKGMNSATVLDKYSNKLDLENSRGDDGKDYFIVADILSGTDFFEVHDMMFGDRNDNTLKVWAKDKLDSNGKQVGGSADIKFLLVKKAANAAVLDSDDTATKGTYSTWEAYIDANPTSYDVVSSVTKTFYNVDPKNITEYKMDGDITKFNLWADTTTAAGVNNVSNYRQTIKVAGFLAGGQKVVLPETATTPNRVGIIDGTQSATPSNRFTTSGKFVYATGVESGTTGADATVAVQVRGYDSIVYNVTLAMKSSNVAPTAKSITPLLTRPKTVTEDTYGNIVATDWGIGNGTVGSLVMNPVESKSANYYEISVANKVYLIGQSLNKTAGYNAMTQPIYFEIVDQYNGKMQVPSSISLISSPQKLVDPDADSNTDNSIYVNKYVISNGAIVMNPVQDSSGNALVTINDVAAGDKIVLTAAKDGLSSTITIEFR